MSDSAPLVSVPIPPARTSKDVQVDYNNTLFKLGVLARASQEQEREVKMLGETLDAFRLEYNQLIAAETKQAAAEAAATKVSGS